jgi:uncharacterized protein (DUF1330 family)
MSYYAVAEIDITDPSWVAGYVANVAGEDVTDAARCSNREAS